MRSAELRELVGSYVKIRQHDPPFKGADVETVRLLELREPEAHEVARGASMNRVWVRRFLVGGWVDTWVYPRDVLAVTVPDGGTLAQIEIVERDIGPWRR